MEGLQETGGANIEIAHQLNEPEKQSRFETPRRTEIVEILEAVVLALVAVCTAWSGYQAAPLGWATKPLIWSLQ